METFHHDTPLANYLEGEGAFEPDQDDLRFLQPREDLTEKAATSSFAPSNKIAPSLKLRRKTILPRIETRPDRHSSINRIHDAWSTAVNSRLGRADNAKFIEHFRYIIVASQLVNEYLDHGSLQPSTLPIRGKDGAQDGKETAFGKINPQGAAAAAFLAFGLVYSIHWIRNIRADFLSKSRILFALAFVGLGAVIGYAHLRRQWLKFLRRDAVNTVSSLTNGWQAFEVAASAILSFIQEVELVSKGYRISSPLPPASRIEEQASSRRCGRLRKALYKAYATTIPTCIEACTSLKSLIEEDDLERYFEIYDISFQDVLEASGEDALSVIDDDTESLKSLRVLSYRANVLRRVTLCYLMALEADGGQPDFYRWRAATEVMKGIEQTVSQLAERLKQTLTESESLAVPSTPAKTTYTPSRDKMRSSVRKISMLSSGIRGLQAKMQILREETNRSIEQSDDLTDVGPNLMTQYESIGVDLKDLVLAWETGKATLQENILKQEKRISMASSSGVRSNVSSLEENGSIADALMALNGESASSTRSSMPTTPLSDEEIFEAIALPKQRSTLSREERIAKMYEDRERQATIRAKRESSTNMLRELESVINLRPKKTVNGTQARITSI
ncbi:Hypothetical protein R9X50_00525000 [Acrodontium crateriforme]|uniref:Vezatin n=1 Tax=Acrodontium crateriforme TaxID=150365 RepID=A0AAQ3MCD4_9PEZI|nr:Hypothetical protein R9X50_00525000 [Acrodontium crateriforme]